MQYLTYVFLYFHKPELVTFQTIKNYNLNYNIIYLKRKITAKVGKSINYKLLVEYEMRCKYENKSILNSQDQYVIKKIGSYFKEKGYQKAAEIHSIYSPIIHKESHMNLLSALIYESNVSMLVLNECNLNDYFFSKLCFFNFPSLVHLNLNKNHLTNHTVKNMSKMNFSNNFAILKLDLNNLDEDALRIIFNSENFKNLVELDIGFKKNRKEKEKFPYKDISKLQKLRKIVCNTDSFLYEVSYEEDQAKKMKLMNK